MRDALRAIAQRLGDGVVLPGTGRRLRLVIEREAPIPIVAADESPEALVDEPWDSGRDQAAAQRTIAQAARIMERHVKAVLDRCAELRPFHHPAMAADLASCEAFLAFCNETALLFRPNARGAHLRGALPRLAGSLTDAEAIAHVRRLIAVSDLEDGVVERAEILRGDAVHGADFEAAIAKFDAAYGANPPYLGNSRHSLELAGDLRGRTLRWFYDQNRDKLRGRRILHIAPEETLESWMRAHAAEWQMTYETLDGFSNITDHVCDLTALPFGDASYDVLICHRVLEHILDDVAALQEMNRVLADDGWLDLSIPESPQLPESLEWLIQDASHHDHVRQYGADLPARIAAAGFAVSVDRNLLERSIEDHRRDGTYPLRHYLCKVSRSGQSAAPSV